MMTIHLWFDITVIGMIFYSYGRYYYISIPRITLESMMLNQGNLQVINANIISCQSEEESILQIAELANFLGKIIFLAMVYGVILTYLNGCGLISLVMIFIGILIYKLFLMIEDGCNGRRRDLERSKLIYYGIYLDTC